MREDDRFQGLNSLSELSIKLVATQKHDLYGKVFLILKLALISGNCNNCGKSIFWIESSERIKQEITCVMSY